MTEYLGNTFSDIEQALKDGKIALTLNRIQMVQVLQIVSSITEAKNEVLRENMELKAKLEEK